MRRTRQIGKKVKFGQKSGSRCYVAHVHATKEERKVEALSVVEIFKTTHNSKKDGFSADVQDAIAKMEEKLVAPVPDGEAPKSDVEIVSEVLTAKCPSSTFLKNVGLRSCSSKSSKSNAVVTAHVRQLEEQLERSQQQTEAMREEMAAMKKQVEEAEAAQAERDKSFELLLKRTEENDASYLHMMMMFAGKTTGN